MDRVFVSADQLLADAFRLARKIVDADFRPDLVIGVWRGGAPVAVGVHEYLAYHRIVADHIAIRTASYRGIDARHATVNVDQLDYVVERAGQFKRVLIVDDVLDTGHSVAALLAQLRDRLGADYPSDLRLAVPWYKPTRNETAVQPDFWLHETDAWIVFPHELIGLSPDEIRAGKPWLGDAFPAALNPVST